MTVTTTTETRADQIVREFLGWAEPVVSGIAAETERIARTLTASGVTDMQIVAYQRSNPEVKAQMLPGIDALRAPKMRRSQYAMEMADLVQTAQRDLAKFLTEVRREVTRSKALAPISADDAISVQSLSTLDPAELLADADRLAEEEPRRADLFLRAAVLGGRLRSTAPGTTYAGIRRKVDEGLDRTEPTRMAAVQRERAALVAYTAARDRIDEVRKAADGVLAAHPEDPFTEIARARTL